MNSIKINFPLILFSLIPVSVILGSGILLVNVVLFGSCFIFFYFTKDYVKIYDTRPVFLLIILYLYLIFNSLISNDITEGFYRNFGFLRFILFFLMVNYLFFVFEKKAFLETIRRIRRIQQKRNHHRQRRNPREWIPVGAIKSRAKLF